MDNLKTLKSKMKKYDLGQNLRLQLKSLKTFNSWMYAILVFSIIFVIITFVNIFYQFRAHLCMYSNTRKCVASDKMCTYKQKAGTAGTATEIFAENTFTIRSNTNSVSDQTLTIEQYRSTTNTFVDIFNMDFIFGTPLPSTGISPPTTRTEYPTAGYEYHSNNKGVSIYLEPFAGQSDLGTSVKTVKYIISETMKDDPSGNVQNINNSDFLFNPTGTCVPNPSGLAYSSLPGTGQFGLGTYVLQGVAASSLEDRVPGKILSTATGVSSLFTNFEQTDVVKLKETETADSPVNVTVLTLSKNLHSRNTCNATTKKGCTCLDPSVISLPPCSDYTYQDSGASEGFYTYNGDSSNYPGPSIVKFCTQFNHNSFNDTNAIAQNLASKQYNSLTSKARQTATYYPKGFGKGTAPLETNYRGRYQLPAVFCSDVSSTGNNFPTDYNPEQNALYKPGQGTVPGWSDIKTSYQSTNPNATAKSDGTVTLGFS